MPTTPNRTIRLAAWAGIVGPIVLASALIVLTLAEYDFMRSLRWHPLEAPTVDWPSGLALGPYGAWMTATFAVCGVLLVLFGWGLRAVIDGRAGRFGALLLGAAGMAMAALSAPTVPTYGGYPQTTFGRIHDASFAALGISFVAALCLLAWSFRRDPRWARFAPFTALLVLVVAPAFLFKGLLFYALLIGVIVWLESVAVRLLSLES